MARKRYESRAQLNVSLPEQVKDGIDRAAQRRDQSTSQLVTSILKAWLSAQGELPEAEPLKEAV
jgi:hypothetical protein